MTDGPDVPNTAEIWDFLVGLKEVTEAGFARLSSDFHGLTVQFADLRSDFTDMKSSFARMQSDLHRMERRLVRGDDRLAAFENLGAAARLDDHERRITRLEQNPGWPSVSEKH